MTSWVGHATSGFVGAAAVAALLLTLGATVRPAPVLDVERINVREPDGTLRMVLSGAAREPGIIVAGHEHPHPTRRSAGILFYNDEGTDNGGLIFDGRRGPDGTTHSGGSLTFDRYKQDQMVQITAEEDGAARYAGLVVNDHPDQPMDFAAIENARRLPQPTGGRLPGSPPRHHARAYVGRNDDGSAEVQLRDAAGGVCQTNVAGWAVGC